MKTITIDVAVIGAGTAGLAAYHAAKAAGVTVALIEGGAYGTTCARVGCMPSKLLIAAADAAHAVDQAPGFGIHVGGPVRVNGREVFERIRRERDRFVGFILRDVDAIAEKDRLRGHARFVNNHTLDIGDHTRVQAKSIVIATGSRATYPDSFKTLGDRLITSDDVFEWQDLPKSVAVIGTGIVGLELAQALHRLGVRVVVLGQGGRVGPFADPVLQAYATACFGAELKLEPAVDIVSMERTTAGVAIVRKGPGGVEKVAHFDLVLAATGRAPNVADLGLDNTTLPLDAKGVPTFDPVTLRTAGKSAASPIFIAGDAVNFIPLLHEATDEGRIAGTNAARVAQGKPVKAGTRRAPISIMFTDPQIAIVGGGFAALEAGRFATGQVSFENQGRARILLRNKGLLHIYADLATGRLLGAEMLAPAAEHLAHLLAWALQSKLTVAQVLEMPIYHPVVEEGLRTALRDLAGKLAGEPRVP